MIDRIVAIAGAALVFSAVAGSALAGPPASVGLPEPATMTLFGLGVAGAFIAKKFVRRK